MNERESLNAVNYEKDRERLCSLSTSNYLLDKDTKIRCIGGVLNGEIINYDGEYVEGVETDEIVGGFRKRLYILKYYRLNGKSLPFYIEQESLYFGTNAEYFIKKYWDSI